MPPTEPDDNEAPDDQNSGSVSVSTPSESIRNSPEYRALQAELRKESRKAGNLTQQLAVARGEAETNRAAAEAARQMEQETQLSTILGQDGVAAWNEIAEMASTDQVGAARRFAQLMAKAQSQPAAAASESQSTESTTEVPAVSAPLPPSRTMDSSAPLSRAVTGPDLEALIASEEAKFRAVVDRNLNTSTRNRVTMKERGEGMMAYMNAAYRKALDRA